MRKFPISLFHGTNYYVLSLEDKEREDLNSMYKVLARAFYRIILGKKQGVEQILNETEYFLNRITSEDNLSFQYEHFYLTSAGFKAKHYAENSWICGELSHLVNEAKKELLVKIGEDKLISYLSSEERHIYERIENLEKGYKIKPVILVYRNVDVTDLISEESGDFIDWETYHDKMISKPHLYEQKSYRTKDGFFHKYQWEELLQL